MNTQQDYRRVFFAFEVLAPWPEKLPEGRYLAETDRHMTVVFLGNVRYPPLEKALTTLPKPDFKVGLAGKFNRCHFLPRHRPNVVAWHVDWLDKEYDLAAYQRVLVDWLELHDFPIRIHEEGFLPHVTVCRRPFRYTDWRKAFHPLPMVIKDLHLYESVGGLRYRPIWTCPLKAPFEEFEHTADLAFRVRGETLQQILRHAQAALAFHYPPLVSALSDHIEVASLDDIIIDLNALIAKVDKREGCPIKAVSFHGKLIEEEDQTLMWEMILDV